MENMKSTRLDLTECISDKQIFVHASNPDHTTSQFRVKIKYSMVLIMFPHLLASLMLHLHYWEPQTNIYILPNFQIKGKCRLNTLTWVCYCCVNDDNCRFSTCGMAQHLPSCQYVLLVLELFSHCLQ